MLKCVAFAIVGLAMSTAGAAIIYLPVQYQYGSGAETYYYGGSDPAVFARADRASQSLAITPRRDVPSVPIRTYSDRLPSQPNAAVYGFNANDARNEAYASVPRYFRMTGTADPSVDSPRFVPPPLAPSAGKAGTIEIKPYVRPPAQPATRPILILPSSPGTTRTVR